MLIADWIARGLRLAGKIQAHARGVDAVAVKIRPESRRSYLRALEALDTPPPVGVPRDEGAFRALAALAGYREALSRAAAALDPVLYSGVAATMSRTYQESQERDAREMRDEAQALVDVAEFDDLDDVAAVLATRPPDAVMGAAEGLAGGLDEYSAALVAKTVRLWRARGDSGEVTAAIERAKNLALGVVLGDPVDLGARVDALHPSQAMGLTFHAAPRPPAEGDGGADGLRVDFTLPQAHSAVRYDMSPLFRAGPGDTSLSGLNFRLVDRLRTITEDGVRHREGARAGPIPPDATLLRSIDGIAYEPLVRPDGAPLTAAALAGPHPRVRALARIQNQALPQVTWTSDEDERLALLEAFEKEEEVPVDPALPRLLERELRVEVSNAGGVPGNWNDFASLAGGHTPSDDPLRSYIARAVARTAERRADVAAASGAAGPGVRSELLVSDFVWMGGAVRALRIRLERALDEAAPAGIGKIAPGALAGEFMQAYRNAVRAALATEGRRVEKTGSLSSPPRFKSTWVRRVAASTRN